MASVVLNPTGEVWQKVTGKPNEDESRIKQDLATIKEWLRKQPHLPDEWEDACLMTFLRCCSFSLEKCKQKLDMYFTMRSACPEYFTDRDIDNPALVHLMSKAHIPTMPGLTPKGRRVCLCRAIDKSLDVEHLPHLFKVAFMAGDIRLREEHKDVTGDVYILDASVVDASHLVKLSPTALKRFFICVQEAYPIKIKEIHIINASPIVDLAYNIVKPLLKDKMKKRIHFHKDYTGLHKFVPMDMLPPEWGGTSSPIEEVHKAWCEKLKEYGDWFKKQESIKANEDLRPGKPTNYDELFGIDGSFRQLAID